MSVATESLQTSTSSAKPSDAAHSAQNQTLAVIQFKTQPEAVNSHYVSISQLPSRKLQYSVWHDLREAEIHGSQLKAPRVRKGPAEKDKTFYSVVDEHNNKIHHDLHGRQRKKYRDKLEDWEHTQLASFPYQELQHRYQVSNSGRIFDRMKDVVFLNLCDNDLLDLSSYSFPKCEYLNLDTNYLASFKKLPILKRVRHLTMKDNEVGTFTGLNNLQKLPLEELFLTGNPISFQMGYRQKIFAALPSLKFLDGVAKQDEDMKPPLSDKQEISCIVS